MRERSNIFLQMSKHNGGSRSSYGSSAHDSLQSHGGNGSPGGKDVRVVDGKLFYEKRWFRRGQTIVVEPKQGDKYTAMISAIGEAFPQHSIF